MWNSRAVKRRPRKQHERGERPVRADPEGSVGDGCARAAATQMDQILAVAE